MPDKDYGKIYQAGRDMMAKGKMMVEMARENGYDVDEDTEKENEKAEQQPDTKSDKKKMIIASLKRKYNK